MLEGLGNTTKKKRCVVQKNSGYWHTRILCRTQFAGTCTRQSAPQLQPQPKLWWFGGSLRAVKIQSTQQTSGCVGAAPTQIARTSNTHRIRAAPKHTGFQAVVHVFIPFAVQASVLSVEGFAFASHIARGVVQGCARRGLALEVGFVVLARRCSGPLTVVGFIRFFFARLLVAECRAIAWVVEHMGKRCQLNATRVHGTTTLDKLPRRKRNVKGMRRQHGCAYLGESARTGWPVRQRHKPQAKSAKKHQGSDGSMLAGAIYQITKVLGQAGFFAAPTLAQRLRNAYRTARHTANATQQGSSVRPALGTIVVA